ncbi:MAG: DUF3467 domain-containing protein [Planctomycetaceae bacterium]
MSTSGEAPASNQPPIQPTIESGDLKSIYTNFARVTGSPEELILDFGLNTQPMGNPTHPVKIDQRLVMNYYTAKRLWVTLRASLLRHEQAFGELEIDIMKRVRLQSSGEAPTQG